MMSVHDLSKYSEIKKLLDVPLDEPIFIIRAKDKAAWLALNDYRYRARFMGAGENVIDRVNESIEQFQLWRENNPDKMKVPD